MPSEISEIGEFNAYVVDVEREGHWDFSDVTGGLDMGHCASIRAVYVQLRGIWPTASPSLPTPFVGPICLAASSVATLSACTAVDKRAGAFDMILHTDNENISRLESQVASKTAEIAAKAEQARSSEDCVRMSEDESWIMSATIRERIPKFCAADALIAQPKRS